MIDVYLIVFFLSLLTLVFLLKLKTATYEQKILGITILIALPVEVLGGYLQSKGINNLFLYHILIPIQYCLYSFIFYIAIKSVLLKNLIFYSIPVALLFSLVLFILDIQTVDTYNSYTIALTSFLTCIWILGYYRQVFTPLEIIYLEREPLFWISTGLLFYSLGCFFVDGLMKELILNYPKLAKFYYYKVFLPLSCFLYVMFLISFICRNLFRKELNKL